MTPDRNAVEKTLRRHLSLFGSPSTTQLEASRARIRERLRTRDGSPVVEAPGDGRASSVGYAWRAALSLAAAAAIIALVVWGPQATVEAAGSVRYGWSFAIERILAAFNRGMADTRAPLRPSAAPAGSAAGGQAAAPSTAPAVAAAGGQAGGPEFEEASIRPCDPDNPPATPAGARGGGANSMRMTPGRLNALCTTVATLIRVAYGYSPMEMDANRDGRMLGMDFNEVYGVGEEDGQRVRGGPDWLRSEQYTIEAVAGAGTSPNAATMRGPMLQRLLERRLQLRAHIETERISAFALTVAKGGPKMKRSTSADCEPLRGREGQPLLFGYPANVLDPPREIDPVRRGEKPSCGMWGHRNGPNQVFLGGDVPIEALTMFLSFQLGRVRVLDRTGLTDRFNFMLEIAIDDNTPGLQNRGRGPLPDLFQKLADRDVPRAATVFPALEEQLGLHLERAQTPREFIVIDHVERPSPN